MSKLVVVLLFAAYLFVDFTSGSSIYRQTEDESSIHSQRDDGDRRSTSNLDKYDEKSDDQESKDSLMTRFVNTMADRVDTAHKLWNEAQSKDKETNEDEANSSPYLSSEKLPYLAKNMQNGFKRAMKSYLGTDDIFSYYVKRQESNPART